MRDKIMLSLLCSCLILLSLQIAAQAGSYDIVTGMYGGTCEVCNSERSEPDNHCKAQCPSECLWADASRESSGFTQSCDADLWESCCYCGYMCNDGEKYEGRCDGQCFVDWTERVDSIDEVVPMTYYCGDASCCLDSDCGECEICDAGTRTCEVADNGAECTSGPGVCFNGACNPDGCNDNGDCPTECQRCNMNTYECYNLAYPLDNTDMWCDDWEGVCQNGECITDNLPPVIPNLQPYNQGDGWVSSSSVMVEWSDFGNPYDQTPAGNRDAVLGCYCLNTIPSDPYNPNSKCTTDPDCGIFGPGQAITHNSPTGGAIYFRVYDPAGNYAPSPTQPYYVRLDTEGPVTTDSHDGQIHGIGYTVTLTCDDSSYSGCDETFYCVYNQGGGPCNPTTSGTSVTIDCPSGTCNRIVRYYSTDVAGNSETIKDTGTITISADVPSCVMGALDEYSGSPVALSWSGTDPLDAGIEEFAVQYSKNGGAYQDWQTFPGSTTSGSFTAAQEGEYSFQCKATNNYDITGHWSSAVSTTIDLNPPTAVTETPEATGEGPFTVECAAIDSIPTTFTYDFQWSTDSSSWQGWVTSSASSSHIFGESDDPDTVDDGDIFYFRCRATDGAGREGQWSPINSTLVDSSPPSCAIADPGAFQNTTAIQFSWSSPDTDAASYELCISTDGSACTAPTTGYTGITETTLDFTGINGNTYHIACRATDLAGNTGDWSSSVNTTIDTTPPSLDDSEYTENLTSTDYEDLIVNITVSDEAGIGNVSLEIGGGKISPKEKSGSSGDTEWSLVWEIPYDTYMAFSVFTITMDDVSGNSNTQDFSYSVFDCNPGDVRECNPMDSTGNTYTRGVCRGTGSRTCQSDNLWGTCVGGTLPTPEDCNDLDDDCDGEVDEDLDNHSCGPSTDLGICQYGTSSCSGGAWTACIGAVYPMARENCDNELDDDCDGTVNNDCDCINNGETKPCGESNVGVCRIGNSTCSGGKWGECIGAIYSSDEVCDNTLDDDCDGLTDCGDSDCLGSYLCEGPEITEPDGEPFPWWWLSVIGVAMLVVLVIVWYYFRSQGEELTWEAVKSKWTPSEWR